MFFVYQMLVPISKTEDKDMVVNDVPALAEDLGRRGGSSADCERNTAYTGIISAWNAFFPFF